MRQGRAEAGHEHLPLTTPDGGRAVAREGRAAITVYVENGGDFSVSFDAVRGAHDGKVVLAPRPHRPAFARRGEARARSRRARLISYPQPGKNYAAKLYFFTARNSGRRRKYLISRELMLGMALAIAHGMANIKDLNNIASARRQKCKVCGCPDKFDFHVPDETWESVVPPRYRNKVVCLACFDKFAFEKQIDYSDSVEVLYFAGERAVFKFAAVAAEAV